MSKPREDKLNQYFIAIIPPSPVYEEALALKNYCKGKYHSKAALNSPPHITLHMPFLWQTEKENKLFQKLQAFFKNYSPIKVCLDNFGAFPPRVIFVNVAKSEALENFEKDIQRFCRKELNLFNARYKDEAFHPHITLAFRDLKKSEFKSVWEEFSAREYKAEFMADKIALLKHNDKFWEVFKEFELETSYSTKNTRALETTEG
jgi:2'-5' RNA ligase